MIRLALRVRRADAELVLVDLLELAPGGVEEIELPALDGEEGAVEYAVYGAPGELPALPDLRAAAGGALVDISTSEVPDDWTERWKHFHRPVLVERPVLDPRRAGTNAQTGAFATGTLPAPPARAGASPEPTGALGEGYAKPLKTSVPRVRGGTSIFVRPPWELTTYPDGALEIVIDPAQAFGTGAHATTRLCLELLLEVAACDPTRAGVLDVGCGSGVLAIAARKLGFGPVLALDNDRESVRATEINATVNDAEIQVRRFDLRGEILPLLDWQGVGGRASTALGTLADADRPVQLASTVVLANLLRPLLLELAETMPGAPRHLIASGLLLEQADEVARAFAKRFGLHERARLARGEWAALWLTGEVASQ